MQRKNNPQNRRMKEIFLLLCLCMLDLTPASELSCDTQLWSRYHDGAEGILFNLTATIGNLDDTALYDPSAWTDQLLIQINISKPVLLRSLLVQNEPGDSGRVTEFELHTSYDCSTYNSQNYRIVYVNNGEFETVLLNKIEFVSCLKMVITDFIEIIPSLSLELVGCAVTQDGSCLHPVPLPAERNGSGSLHRVRDLAFDQEILLTWLTVELHSNHSAVESYFNIYYSANCTNLLYYDLDNATLLSVMSNDRKSKWMTVKLNNPVSAKCLALYPSVKTDIGKIYTNRCNRSGCGVKPSADHGRTKRIVNGVINRVGEWPWLVSLHHLLNALSNVSNWRIYFGLHDLTDDKNERVQMRLIEKVYIYPMYNDTLNLKLWDIALVHLSEPVQYTRYISPICLDESELFYNESRCTATGWGPLRLVPGFGFPVNRFQNSGNLRVISPVECDLIVTETVGDSPIPRTVVCTLGDVYDESNSTNRSPCNGDSGGPLMCEVSGRWYQVGIVSTVYGCALPGLPSFHTRVTSFKSWIKDTMALEETNG
ncbi:enteropeptidase-like isoform X2 [Physella acuta]|uniref:enteropeptidase-like isoform X2 n=1 Tax=Physella acuta TaxID=109671 RepID=UPI0027DD7843|nr:enteropeptidase-like isoform X2 [Physella acuta]